MLRVMSLVHASFQEGEHELESMDDGASGEATQYLYTNASLLRSDWSPYSELQRGQWTAVLFRARFVYIGKDHIDEITQAFFRRYSEPVGQAVLSGYLDRSPQSPPRAAFLVAEQHLQYELADPYD